VIIRIKDDKGKLMGKTAFPCKTWTLSQDDVFRNDEAFNVDKLSAGIATTIEVMIGGKVVNSSYLVEKRKVEAGEGLSFRPGLFAIEFPHAVGSDEKNIRKNAIAEMKERCAQAAEQPCYASIGREIAADIRALKDKP
jgi:hypothetical protein